ncbi:MAG: chemotaxis protein CheW [Pseudomonadota bacterium]
MSGGRTGFDATAQAAAHTARVLRARAQALARRVADPPAAGDMLEVLEFRLATERYAIETRHVREVCALQQLTRLPCAPAFVLGIVNLRGRIVPVLDLKKLLRLPQQGLADLHRIVLVGGDELEFGVLADIGVAVRQVPAGSLQPPLPTLGSTGAAYLKGVTADRLMVLDMDHILTDPRILVDETPDET